MVLLKAITQSILGQNLNPGTFSESREQELSFCTKVSRINSIIDREISCLEKRPVLLPTIVSNPVHLQDFLPSHQSRKHKIELGSQIVKHVIDKEHFG